MNCFLAALGVACLSSENPGFEREHLQIHGGVSGGCSHGGTARLGGSPPPLLNPLYDLIDE